MPRRAREHEEVAKEASWNAEVLGDRFSLSVYSTRPVCLKLLRGAWVATCTDMMHSDVPPCLLAVTC